MSNFKIKGKKIVILGIGNILRGDDGIGSIFTERIKGRVRFEVINAGNCPENYLYKIIKIKPDTLLIVDAVDFGGLAGEIKIFNYDKIREIKFYSTHNITLNSLINLLLQEGIKSIIILAIQPKEVNFNSQLSKEGKKALRKLEKIVLRR